MRKLFVISVVLTLLASLALASACGTGSGLSNEPSALTSNVPADQGTEKIVAEARVVPVRSAALGLPVGGTAAEVLVAEGDHVEAGQVLVRLDPARLRAAAARAEAGLRGARAALDELQAGPRPQEVAAAEGSLAAARAALQKLQEGAGEEQIVAARAEAANAEAALRQAQAAYDRVSAWPGAGARPESLQLQQATNNYVAAKGRLDALLKGASAADVAGAEAEIERAQAQLELLKAGARPEAIAAAKANVAAAEAALLEAQAALAETELKAPFAGTVAAPEVKAGEQIAMGASIIQLADLSAWQIESDDVTELSVAGVRKGAAVTVTFDALPGLELPGTVTRISPFGANMQGDIVYRVTIQLERQDERLRWNMTAYVAISPQ